MAMTGFFYTFKRPRTALPMGLMKYDPIGTRNTTSEAGTALEETPQANPPGSQCARRYSSSNPREKANKRPKKIEFRDRVYFYNHTPFFRFPAIQAATRMTSSRQRDAAAVETTLSLCIITHAYLEFTDGPLTSHVRLVLTC